MAPGHQLGRGRPAVSGLAVGAGRRRQGDPGDRGARPDQDEAGRDPGQEAVARARSEQEQQPGRLARLKICGNRMKTRRYRGRRRG